MSELFGNIYSGKVLKDALYEAFEQLDKILIDHAGPFATNCVIGSKWRQVNDVDEFTKDGIKILRHLIVSEEASARFAARLVRFIGIAVDKRCHDGTTTSMLLFCRLAKIAISTMDKDIRSSERYHWWNSILHVLTVCLREIDHLKITEDDLLERAESFGIDTNIADVRAAMAFHMAMISSKGDEDLATKIAYVIRSSPKKIYGMFKDTPLATETEERYILRKQDYDISINANIGNVNDYNYRSDTQFLSTNAVLFVTGNEITKGTMESEFLNSLISPNPRFRSDLSTFGVDSGWETFLEEGRNLLILTPMFTDTDLIMNINEFNKKHPRNRISFFNMQVHGRMRTSLNKTLHYMAGSPLFQDVMESDVMASFIGLKGPKIRAHLIGNILQLTGLYEKDGEVFHPFHRDSESFPQYKAFCEEVEELIEFAQVNITNKALDPEEVTYLVSLYRALTCQDIYDIDIGGSAHDQYANRTVYEDAIGAALSAVNDGVILGGYGHLARFMRIINSGDEAIFTQFEEAFTSIVSDSIRHPDQKYVSLLLTDMEDKWSYVVADPSRYIQRSAPEYASVEHFDKSMMESFLKRTGGKPILLQAWSGYHEQFKRFKDILPKIGNSTSLADMRIKEESDVR